MLSQSNSRLLQSKQLRVSPRAPLALVESPDASEIGFCTREILTKEPNGYSLGTKKKLDESWGSLLNHWIWKLQGVADDTPNKFIQSQQSHAIKRPSYQPPAGSGYLKSIMAGLMKKQWLFLSIPFNSYQFGFKKKRVTWFLMIRLEFGWILCWQLPPITAWGFAGTSEGNGSTLSAAGKGRGKNDEMMMQNAIMNSNKCKLQGWYLTID